MFLHFQAHHLVTHWVDIVFHDSGLLINISKELAKQPKHRLRQLFRSKNQLSFIFNGKRVYARRRKKSGVGPAKAIYYSKTMNRKLCPS
jgi:hypothetical protein